MTAPSSRRWPRIVAESLAGVSDPLRTVGRRPESATLAAVQAAAVAAFAVGRAIERPPAFLQLHQVDAWRRAHFAMARFGGALLAEPVGSGKSWIALGLAHSEHRPALVIAPAVLLEQWHQTSAAAGVPIQTWSHERLSRGSLPPGQHSLVVVDEAHRFRDPAIRRVATLAPWLLGRRTLLLTATPIVNQLRDLVTLLRLIVPEDALLLDGIPSLPAIAQLEIPPVALRRLVIRSAATPRYADRQLHRIGTSPQEAARIERAIAGIDSLVLSRTPAFRRLLRSVLLDAAASSDAALHRACARYRALLLHGRDAGGVSRASIRQFAGEALEQLVFWDLLGTDHDGELALEDIDRVDTIRAAPPDDSAWIEELVSAIPPLHSGDGVRGQADAGVTVCFTRHRATAQALRESLGDAVGWVTGSDAGIGPHRLTRAVLLEAFGTRRHLWRARREPPRLLIATDVAAEGLDLQSAGCLVHVDLPWTAMRVEQREGRLLRIGQQHQQVRVVVRVPPPAMEAALASRARIRRKRSLSERWLAALGRSAATVTALPAVPLVATVADGSPDAALLVVATSRGTHTGARILVRIGDESWCADPAAAAALWQRAHAGIGGTLAAIPDDLAFDFATALREVVGALAPAPGSTPSLTGRIQRLARTAAARRDAAALAALDRLLRFAIAPPTLGGRILIDTLAAAPDRDLLRTPVPDLPRQSAVAARVVAALLFRSSAAPLRCPDA